MSWYRNQLEAYLAQLSINAGTVFDIGGGSNPVSKRVKFWDVNNYYIYDNEQEKSVAGIDKNLDLNNPIADPTLFDTADIVFCLEVFEYIWSPNVACKNIYNCLRNAGKAYITFPFVYPQHEPVEKDYLRYTEAGVKKLLTNAGFSLEKIKITPRTDRSYLLRDFYQADGMHPSKKEGINHMAYGWIVEVEK